MGFWTQNPYSLEKLKHYDYLSDTELETSIQRAFSAWQAGRNAPAGFRRQGLLRMAAELRKNQQLLAKTISLEMGKPFVDSLAEIEKSALACEYFSEQFEEWLASEKIASLEGRSILKTSLGPCLMIMPWNYPLWQVIRFAAPGLAAGNSVLLKGSDIVAGTTELVTEIFQTSFGAQHFQNLCISHDQVARVIADPRVRGVTLTGSTAAGRVVGALAGAHLKKAVLELGGNDPYLLLEDCDVSLAARLCAVGRTLNTGQSCVAAKRFFVPMKNFDHFCEGFSEHLRSYVPGDPLLPETSFGVLAHERFKHQLSLQVEQLRASGGGGVELHWQSEWQGRGAFYAPQILSANLDCKSSHSVELFGPVALVYSYENLQDAIRAANSSPYGLGAAVFSKDIERARRVAQELESGQVAINDFIKSDARLPFGGVKDSGFGRELSRYGFQEFLNLRSLTERPG